MNSPDAATTLGAMRTAVNAGLEGLLAGESRLFEALRYAVLPGGKRFRPLLVLAAGEAFGGDRATLMPYACAVELIHSYSLVHDDLPCMDDDDLRRGKPSCHRAFGEAQALLAGDGLLTLAFEVLAAAPAGAAGPDRKDRAVGELARAAGVRGMIAGQWADIEYAADKADTSSLLELLALKTGAIIRASAVAGALVGGALEPGLAAIEAYGRGVGLAFQLRDDLLDSGKGTEARSGTRPNAAALFGAKDTRTRLEKAIDGALGALEGAAIGSAELRALAAGLRDIG